APGPATSGRRDPQSSLEGRLGPGARQTSRPFLLCNGRRADVPSLRSLRCGRGDLTRTGLLPASTRMHRAVPARRAPESAGRIVPRVAASPPGHLGRLDARDGPGQPATARVAIQPPGGRVPASLLTRGSGPAGPGTLPGGDRIPLH